jgi:enoyl-[acyl-carrier protein] reductase/trans-2-enoyl-CoA reductase (NAD+)
LKGPKNVLVIGSSNGYGLASRIVSAFACGSATLGVAFEKQGKGTRPGTAGWYNTIAFERNAKDAGLRAWSINGDAYSHEIKSESIVLIKENMGAVDLIIYSIAAPRRMDPDTGKLHSTVIKPIGHSFKSKAVDFQTGKVFELTAEPASQDEIDQTIKVMGGEDWQLWIKLLLNQGVLAEHVTTVAFSYIGPAQTNPIYRDGTIGKAKEHLENTAREIQCLLAEKGGRALISVNKALVTRASAVIPAVPLYISLLYRVMKKKGIHEGCIQQMDRLFRKNLYSHRPLPLDDRGRIRLDDLEMRTDVQQEVARLWNRINTENFNIQEFRDEFLMHHGFGMKDVYYTEEVEV